jgi:hypothetical protein
MACVWARYAWVCGCCLPCFFRARIQRQFLNRIKSGANRFLAEVWPAHVRLQLGEKLIHREIGRRRSRFVGRNALRVSRF